jgi:predicted Zn-dependent protease with MMP-like domain
VAETWLRQALLLSLGVVTVSPERFDELVRQALDALPDDLAKQMDNVVVKVEASDGGRHLYGLYEGVPLTKRGPLSYGGAFPDRITIFQDTISAHSRNEHELERRVRITVFHEVAHHFGLSDERLKELGWA